MTSDFTLTKNNIIAWLQAAQTALEENREYLTQLDAAIGDADHGTNMSRGFKVAVKHLPTVEESDIGNILKTFGMKLQSSIGGASGPLYGTFFMKAGMAVSVKETLSGFDLLHMIDEGIKGVQQRGRASVGDKTMIDTWEPMVITLEEKLEEQPLPVALEAAVDAAEKGMKSTIPLQSRKGRASYLGERSIGHQDPGATSAFLIFKALLITLQETNGSG